MNHKIMKAHITIFLSLVFFSICSGQSWTPPVNVSNMESSSFPDIAIDGNGIIHIVWIAIFENNVRKVMYSYSNDDGETWSIPFDVSQNSEKALWSANIVIGSDGKLYVSYDYDIGNYYETLVHMKIFDGMDWSPTIVVSEGMPHSHSNILVKDFEDRVYVFWFYGYSFCYRYLEGHEWSDVIFPYEEQHTIESAVSDSDNNIHCAGHYTYWGKTVPGVRITYFKYNKSSDVWSDMSIINEDDVNIGVDIDLDNNFLPHILWNKDFTHSSPGIRGHVYCHQIAENIWSEEEFVEFCGPNAFQKIHLNEQGHVNVFLTKEFGEGYEFDHCYKSDDTWSCTRIDSSDNSMILGRPNVDEMEGILYIAYGKCSDRGHCNTCLQSPI